MKARRLAPLALGLGLSVIVGWMVLSRLGWRDIEGLWARATPAYLALGLVLYFAANVLRARRFRALTGDVIATTAMLRAVIVQNILNTFLPLRAGEVSYLYMVHQSGAVKAGHNVGSLLGARVLDLLAALVLPLLALPFSRAWSAEGQPFVWFVTVATFAGGVFAVGIWQAEPLSRFFQRRARTGWAWLNRLLGLCGDVLASLAQLRGASLLRRVVGLTLGCWGLVYLSGYVCLLAVGISVPIPDAIFAYSFPVIASMTPFYMLGGFGVYEGSVGMGLHLVGVPVAVALASGLLLHLVELLFVLCLGPLALVLRAPTRLSSSGLAKPIHRDSAAVTPLE